ncbi:MAG: hypothetical protein ACI4UE_05405 [Candidatus Scatovivens sp.]
MENTTKALYMATGVLIGILILTAFVFVFAKGGQMLGTAENKKASEQIEDYNSKLIIYNRTGEENNYNTIFDVVTACNLAYDINNQNMFDNKNYLIVELVVIRGSEEYILDNLESQKKGYIGDEKLTSLITRYGQQIEYSGKYIYEHKFKGEVEFDMDSGKINKIIFTKI